MAGSAARASIIRRHDAGLAPARARRRPASSRARRDAAATGPSARNETAPPTLAPCAAPHGPLPGGATGRRRRPRAQSTPIIRTSSPESSQGSSRLLRTPDVAGRVLLERLPGFLGEEMVGDAAVLGPALREGAGEGPAEDDIRDLRPLLVVGVEEQADVGLGEG